MVNLVEDWKVLENYAGFKRGFYQLIDDEQVIEICLKVGELGFKKEFTNKEDTSLINILDFCKSKKYIEVSNNIMDEFFFKHIPEKEEEK